jgi:hypothetical protein
VEDRLCGRKGFGKLAGSNPKQPLASDPGGKGNLRIQGIPQIHQGSVFLPSSSPSQEL